MNTIKVNSGFTIPAFLNRAFANHADYDRVTKSGSVGTVTKEGAAFFAARTCNMEAPALAKSLAEVKYHKAQYQGTAWAVNKGGNPYPVGSTSESRTLFFHALIYLSNMQKTATVVKAKSKTAVQQHVTT